MEVYANYRPLIQVKLLEDKHALCHIEYTILGPDCMFNGVQKYPPVTISLQKRSSCLEVGCSSRGKSTAIFVPKGRDRRRWVDFLEFLRRTALKVTGNYRRCDSTPARESSSTSVRDASSVPVMEASSMPAMEGSMGGQCPRCANCSCC